MNKKVGVLIVVVGILLAIMIVTILIKKTGPQNQTAKVVRDSVTIGVKGDILGFQPKMTGYETPTMSTNFNIFDGLVELNKDYKVIPSLAESWSNPDKLTWRFYLRHGVKFQNGDAFTAADVKYSIDYIMNDKGNILKDMLAQVESVKIVDEFTIDIITKEASPILLNKLADVLIMPKRYAQIPAEEWPVGTGAYKLKEYVKGDHITLERFDGYWGGPAPIKTVVLKIMPDNEQRTAALLNNTIDMAESITPSGYKQLLGSSKIVPVSIPGTRVVYLSFDFRKFGSHGFKESENPTADIRVRRAIYHAINEDRIISDIMDNTGVPTSQFVSDNIFGFNPSIARLPHDLEIAKKLMKEAGYENGFDIKMDCTNNRYINDEAICREIAKQLLNINIKVTVNAIDKKEFFPLVLSHKTSFYMLGWSVDTADGGEIFDYLLRTVNEKELIGSYNIGYYSNPEVDRLGKASQQVVNPIERLAILQQGFKIATDDVAWIPLHLQKIYCGLSSELKWDPRSDEKLKLKDISFK